MAEKWLFEIEIRAYAYAEDEETAIEAFEQGVGYLDGVSLKADKTDSVDADWWDALPFGEAGHHTCGQILQAQREAEEAQREAQEAATPDPNQLTIEEVEG